MLALLSTFALLIFSSIYFIFFRNVWVRGGDTASLKGIPVVPGHWFYGSIFNTSEFFTLFKQYRQQYGDVFIIRMFTSKVVIVSNPAVARKVFSSSFERNGPTSEPFVNKKSLFTLKEDDWRPHRRLMNRFFNSSAISQMIPKINQATLDSIESLKKISKNEQAVFLSQFLHRTILDMLLRCIFSAEYSADYEDILEGISLLNDNVMKARFLENAGVLRLFNPFAKPTLKGNEILERHSRKRLNERKKLMTLGENVPNDILTFLIEEYNEDEQFIIDNLVMLFFAGQDTTSLSLFWAILLLCQNLPVMKKLQAEIDLVFENNGLDQTGIITEELLLQMPYLDMVLKESLRLYPVTLGASRVLKDDLEVDGYNLPKGTYVVVSFVGLHSREQNWERPNEFYPEHFSPKNVENRLSNTYSPFGGGARTCIGMKMAQHKQRIILAHLLRHFDIEFQNKTPTKISPITGLTIHPDKDIQIKFSPRVFTNP